MSSRSARVTAATPRAQGVTQDQHRARSAENGAADLHVDGLRKYPKSRLLASSANRGWLTLFAELRSHPSGTITPSIRQNVEIVIALCGADDGFIVRTGAGRQMRTRTASGTIWLTPVGFGDEEVTISAPIPKALHLYLPARQFDRLADQYNLARSPVHSIPRLSGLNDELIRQIGVAVLSEMTRETPTGRMFAETASLILAARLVHDYAGTLCVEPCPDSPHRLDNARLRRVLEYIDQHLEQELTVAGLADRANLSAFHFSRMFAAAVGDPPYRYISRRRLENAKSMLAVGKLSLSEIAHRSRFASQASFHRAFRRATGVTPGEYRRLVR
jgi:AraC family transcriptional regulator